MRVLPVIDLLRGQVVRGVAGDRANYRPIQSRLAHDSTPAAIGGALVELGFRECYVADLDAIAGAEPSWEDYAALMRLGLELWLDAGCARVDAAEKLSAFRVDGGRLKRILVALETLASPDDLGRLTRAIERDRAVFSVDLKHGRPVTRIPEWQAAAPRRIVEYARECGVRRFVILDLAAVGMNGGPATTELCSSLRSTYGADEIISGGGVRDVADLRAFAAAGCDYTLVASALHDGRIAEQELTEFR